MFYEAYLQVKTSRWIIFNINFQIVDGRLNNKQIEKLQNW